MNTLKNAIDNISTTGIAYENKHHATSKGLFLLSYTPCIVYSVVVRMISCPFQFIFNKDVSCNPFYASIRQLYIQRDENS